MRSNIEGANISDCLNLSGNRFGLARMTLAADGVVPPDSPHVLVVDSGGVARNLNLPANPQVGDWFTIFANNAAGAVTLRNSAGAALVPAVVVAANTVGQTVIYTGLAEPGGWRAEA